MLVGVVGGVLAMLTDKRFLALVCLIWQAFILFFRGAYLSVLSLRACIRLGSIFLFFPAVGSRSQVRHLIALLFLVPPAAKEGKGDCEFPLCPPWILLLPLCNAGHCVPGGGYGIGLLSLMPFITGGRFYGTWLIWLPCSLA